MPFTVEWRSLLRCVRPPMVERVSSEQLGVLRDRLALLGQRFFQLVEALEEPVGYALVYQRPQSRPAAPSKYLWNQAVATSALLQQFYSSFTVDSINPGEQRRT